MACTTALFIKAVGVDCYCSEKNRGYRNSAKNSVLHSRAPNWCPIFKGAPFSTYFFFATRGHHFQHFCGKWCPFGRAHFAIRELFWCLFLLKRAPFFKTVPKGDCFGSVFFSQCVLSWPCWFNLELWIASLLNNISELHHFINSCIAKYSPFTALIL